MKGLCNESDRENVSCPVIPYHCFHRWSEWQAELVSAYRDISSETLDSRAANSDPSSRLRAER